MEEVVKEGKYIYCIITTTVAKTFGSIGIGCRGDELYTICFQNIAAVVSNSPIIKYSISRENTLAHEKAIEEVMKEHTVLPVRFATIAEDEEKVKKILEKEYDRFVALLKDMKGKKELGLKAIFKEDVIYKYILEKYKDIERLKERVSALPPEKTYYQRMEIGKMVEAALQKEKEIHKKGILNTLSPLAVEVKNNNTYGELMIISAAFLVEKYREPEFDQKVNEYVNKYGNKINFKYVGTVPPFNFVNLIINTEEY
ncbi:MAG: gas vesicle synthesis GvpLGvpF [Candidatus Infernicultor aquiphilus]|uniref:Gas vesicle synthesis GvpLGvpF n=1 Tax=Candidatus Infernicultor aquiphilus TaxID=1805029 RepID=A0A2M7PS30_9BACT|nr:GvpL/GvpF family gas vesicle protein [bacterium]PIW11540.1 MAG: gas vesicle synthesis GvpLGvpF [Candidatus Atribacteria bacterium CG17_big_fil_post_rev_8_21_14_2_50_34_11]PIX33836.1 MAG: gas vesicle synthesis GvpLGvpF [Candidatus Atribacteria bacterium CG_4_8_14_3_um_filter_34_18]PIY33418.1 MAG: gas vesicle synthesis GvpLGvpF [Candidatus Atribacteria bacterium CG_4_10_14_3_um_filter_34_13]PJB55906.1 MAG: gas vesicle synthesis GvpLGvpF [Candidatus Atribacteria bacterium CG_4_9_14_3_um_filter_